MPAELSEWSKIKRNENETAYLRYNVTAKRTGFKQSAQGVPFMLDLTQDKKDLRALYKGLFP